MCIRDRFNIFKARSSPEYLALVFLKSEDLEKSDPIKKVLEAAFKARKLSSTKPNLSKEYSKLADDREEWVVSLLEMCSTEREVISFLQTTLPSSCNVEANFALAILDGHKKIVAAQSYQHVVRQKWSSSTLPREDEEDAELDNNHDWNEMDSKLKVLHLSKKQ